MSENKDQSDKQIYQLVLHMGKVQGIAFSATDRHLYTIGGQDDNALVCWNLDTGESKDKSWTSWGVIGCLLGQPIKKLKILGDSYQGREGQIINIGGLE